MQAHVLSQLWYNTHVVVEYLLLTYSLEPVNSIWKGSCCDVPKAWGKVVQVFGGVACVRTQLRGDDYVESREAVQTKPTTPVRWDFGIKS